QDVAVRAGRGDHRHVQGRLQVPAGPHPRGGPGGGVSPLVDLAEAPAGGCAGGQAVLSPVGGQVLGQVGGVERDRDRHHGVRVPAHRQLVRRFDGPGAPSGRLRRETADTGGDGAVHRDLRPVQREAACVPEPGRRAGRLDGGRGGGGRGGTRRGGRGGGRA